MASYREENPGRNKYPPSGHVSLSRKGMPGPGGHPQDFDINISNKPNIYFNKKLYIWISNCIHLKNIV
jgi:hypothetical protein